MQRVFNKAKNHKEAEEWDIKQQLSMTPDERRRISNELKKRFYGENPPDVRDTREFKTFSILKKEKNNV